MSELKLQQCRLDGRYDILECLGRGSYSEIFLARDLSAGGAAPHYVVIKALNVFLQGSIDQELERTLIDNFRNEAVALDRVRHPNIINRLGHGTAIDLSDRTFHYLVLEYLPGGDMAALCRKSPLTLERALFYTEQICDGLAHAHAHSVIHRDIKPQNLLLTADREILKIADFGVAKIESMEGAITRVGTDIYAAPEHHPMTQSGSMLNTGSLSQPVTLLTPAADIYSLAKTTYMLLTGEAPRRFALKQLEDLPEPMAQQPWASFVLRVLRQATETNPAKRYQKVEEYWEELSDAAMPKTRLLVQAQGEETTQLSSPRRKGETAPLPPEPQPAHFAPPSQTQVARLQAPVRPRIVVPINLSSPPTVEKPLPEKPAESKLAVSPVKAAQRAAKPTTPTPVRPEGWNLRRWLVALLLIAGFALILLGTDRFVRSRQSPPPTSRPSAPVATAATSQFQIGREMATTTSVNLRGGPNRSYERLGILGAGSRVRILQANNNWVEVSVVELNGASEEVDRSDRGWIDGTRLR